MPTPVTPLVAPSPTGATAPLAQPGAILLVVPPFAMASRPVLSVSQIKTTLAAAGFSAKVLYLNLRFAERIGWDSFEWVSRRLYQLLFGEFIFSCVLFQRSKHDVQRYVDRVLGSLPPEEVVLPQYHSDMSTTEKLQHLIGEAADFCREAGREILAHDPWIAGFTSSFHQNCASLSLIREIKERRPGVITALGGANCEGEMGEELLVQFPLVDYVCQGECDLSFVELVRSIRAGCAEPVIPGVLIQGRGRQRSHPRPLTSDELDKLPYPDFSEYFYHLKVADPAKRVVPLLALETSRGCWWGAKHHCTFCSFGGSNQVFRSKSPARVVDEIKTLVGRYGTKGVSVADNIMDMSYFKTVLPRLAASPVAEMYFEVKANLTKEQAHLLFPAGIKAVQPGIESLSDRSLKLMQKGSTKIQNIQIMKWCAETRVQVLWNYLYGFPNESDDELSQIAEEAEALHHLAPPRGAASLRLDRFSPHFEEAERFGLTPVSVSEPYKHVYPFPDDSLMRLSFFFDCDYFIEKSKSEGLARLKRIAAEWEERFDRSYLVAIPRKRCLHIIDTRRCAQRHWHRLTGVARKVYEYCDQARSLAQIQKLFESVEVGKLEKILQSLVRNKLILFHDGRYLSLAVDGRYGYKKAVYLFGGYVRPAGRSESRRRFPQVLALATSPARVVHGVQSRASSFKRRMLANALARMIDMFVRRCQV